MRELTGIEREVLDALKTQPHSVDALLRVLHGPSELEVRAALRGLNTRRLVTEIHVLTNPPKTLYRRTDN